jgi:hypothetical protein
VNAARRQDTGKNKTAPNGRRCQSKLVIGGLAGLPLATESHFLRKLRPGGGIVWCHHRV